jgi:hypothetical protein
VTDAEVQRRPQAVVPCQKTASIDELGMTIEDLDDARGFTLIRSGEKCGQLNVLAEGALRQRGLERGPAFVSALARECVLDVAQSCNHGSARVRAAETLLRSGIAGAERREPSLRFLPEIVEGTHGQPSFR